MVYWTNYIPKRKGGKGRRRHVVNFGGKKGHGEKPQSLWLSGKHENDERTLEEKKQESMRKPSTEPRALSKEGPLV